MGRLIAIILLVMVGALSKKREKKKAAAAKPVPPRAAAPAPAAHQPAPLPMQQAGQTQPEVLQTEQIDHAEQREGSIPYMPEPDHVHEGKPDAPCPAQQRMQPRAAANADAGTARQADAAPALTLDFADSRSVVQGVIMSEVLRRPQFINGRRVIR